MGTSLTPRQRQQLAELETFQQRVQHIHGLVERFAAERIDPHPHILAAKRAFARLKREFATAGMDDMAQMCGALEQSAHRGGSQPFKARVLREGVGSLRMLIETQQRVIRMARPEHGPDDVE